jgi:hypothetical protein
MPILFRWNIPRLFSIPLCRAAYYPFGGRFSRLDSDALLGHTVKSWSVNTSRLIVTYRRSMTALAIWGKSRIHPETSVSGMSYG